MTSPAEPPKFTVISSTAAVLSSALVALAGSESAQALPKDSGAEETVASAASSARLTVAIDGFRNNRGQALVALFRKAGAFPAQVEQAERRAESTITNLRAQVVFEQVPPGELALSVLHDEDNDRVCRLGLFGIPKEGLGFSRNVRARFGPPDFADAKLKLAAGAQVSIAIHMRYYGF